jgi:hypothetical protein
MNEDGHVSIPRRGYIAAGLAVAVVGSLGVISTMNAGADEVSEAPPAVATFDTPLDAPALLPWGEKPKKLKKGRAGATSAQLAAAGADIAPDAKDGSVIPQPEFGPKGYTSKKRTLHRGRTTVPPQPPLAEPVPGAARDVKYHYATAYQYVETDGTYANLVIGRPTLAKEDYHTLAEIAVQSADGQQIVEVGWTVDRGVNEGSEDPHLFVYHWVNGKETCYNACGFVQYSKTVTPGYVLPQGASKQFGIQYANGAWWIAYDSEWVGYFPDKLWFGNFTRSGLVQWFGEVASSNSQPCTAMGTGEPPTSGKAARIGTISLMNDKAPAYLTKPRSPETDDPIYKMVPLTDRTFRYGGPGWVGNPDDPTDKECPPA